MSSSRAWVWRLCARLLVSRGTCRGAGYPGVLWGVPRGCRGIPGAGEILCFGQWRAVGVRTEVDLCAQFRAGAVVRMDLTGRVRAHGGGRLGGGVTAGPGGLSGGRGGQVTSGATCLIRSSSRSSSPPSRTTRRPAMARVARPCSAIQNRPARARASRSSSSPWCPEHCRR